jgi:hypothetical protein
MSYDTAIETRGDSLATLNPQGRTGDDYKIMTQLKVVFFQALGFPVNYSYT